MNDKQWELATTEPGTRVVHSAMTDAMLQHVEDYKVARLNYWKVGRWVVDGWTLVDGPASVFGGVAGWPASVVVGVVIW